jgi:hypothetical protein
MERKELVNSLEVLRLALCLVEHLADLSVEIAEDATSGGRVVVAEETVYRVEVLICLARFILNRGNAAVDAT